ncbi:MAG: right-handed parallel beta-helix repeat-containing protein, partial [Firmicutes bacterium]|nr:right-handed parallel beta-helix repeat-containing protein [Bacillota bacterium]
MAEDEPVPKITADIRDNVIAENEGGGIRLGWWWELGGFTAPPGDITATIEGNRIYNNEGGSLRVKSADEVDVTVTENDFQLTDYDLEAGGVIRIGHASEDYDNDISETVKARICGNVINCGKADDDVYIGGVIRVNGAEIETEISKNEITAGYNVGGLIRVGQSGCKSGLVATNVTAEITDNVMDLDTDDLGGGIRVYATDEIDATVTGNSFGGFPLYEGVYKGGGIRIGHFADEHKNFDYPPTETVKAVVSDNHLALFGGGGIRIIASEEIDAEVNDNTISECYGGAIRVGWFCYDWEWENTEGEETGVTPVVSAEISGNTVTDNHAVGIHLEGSASVSGTISGNRVLGTRECYYGPGTGIYVGNEDAAEVDVTVNNNAIVGNVTGLICEIDESADPLDATQNWWGNAYGPDVSPLPFGEIVDAGIYFEPGDACWGNVEGSPWLLSEPPATETLVTETLELDEGETVGIEGLLSVEVEKGAGLVTYAQYGANPAPVTPIGGIGGYFDVYYEADFLEAGDIDSLLIKLFYDDEDLPEGVMKDRVTLLWWNGEKWLACSDSGVSEDIAPSNGAETGKYAWARITAATTPSIADLLVGGFTIGEPALYGDVCRDG